jgi:uncharacterized membrane protein YebE (DUF533 family)
MPEINTPQTPRRRPPGSWKGKALAVGTTVALAGLAGVALESNKGMPTPAATQQVATAHGTAPIVTRTSGSAATAQPVAAKRAKQAPAQPIVTRASGGGAPRFEDD